MNKSRVPATPISFRMPKELRTRLRRFAEQRNLGEAEALRLVVSEHLAEVDDARELVEAERWQFEQAYATWQRILSGEEQTFDTRASIDRVFEDARAKLRSRKLST